MEVTGEITATEVNIQIDVDDLASDISDNIDWEDRSSDNIDIGLEVESLLDQYHNNDSPCGVGKSFEKAVWWAMVSAGVVTSVVSYIWVSHRIRSVEIHTSSGATTETGLKH